MNDIRWVLGVSLLLAPGTATAAAEGPNVVMIIGDDQAWGDFGFMGHPVIQTPNLDRLASQSLVFTRGYVPSSLCRPSLATLATGLYPHQHKITSNDPPNGIPQAEFLRQRQQQIDYIDQVPTLPRVLATRGYVSFQTGKWWEGNHSRGGFTSGMTHGDPARGGRHGDAGLKIGREGLEPIFDFIKSAGDRPFFIWYAPFLPHAPHNPPEALLAKYRDKTDSIHVARYWAMCEWFDQTCGELLGHLDRKGLAENTLVVFVTDNGWIQQPDAGNYAPRSKRSPNEGGIRTPIMLRWPKRIEPARDAQTPAISIDLAPTILAACGLEPTESMQGVSLLDRAALQKREAIFGEIFTHNAIDIHDPASNLEYRWCIEGRWKLIVPRAPNVTENKAQLYDLAEDPHENADQAGRQPEQVKRLLTKLDAWWPGRPNDNREVTGQERERKRPG
ncbi:MAG TPA: sulfatase [Thermoguttaceae bacterium]|nr:sulfatase [Thermoguttaceae bacterium]